MYPAHGHGDRYQTSDKTVLFCGRDDDRQEHTVEGDAQRIDGRCRQDIADQDSHDSSPGPAGNRDKGDRIAVKGFKISRHLMQVEIISMTPAWDSISIRAANSPADATMPVDIRKD